MREGLIMVPRPRYRNAVPPNSCGGYAIIAGSVARQVLIEGYASTGREGVFLRVCLSKSFECDLNRFIVYERRSKLISCQLPVPDVQVFPEK